jgi:hypothetical protein
MEGSLEIVRVLLSNDQADVVGIPLGHDGAPLRLGRCCGVTAWRFLFSQRVPRPRVQSLRRICRPL